MKNDSQHSSVETSTETSDDKISVLGYIAAGGMLLGTYAVFRLVFISVLTAAKIHCVWTEIWKGKNES